MPFVVALTGGIGSGKTMVSHLFGELGIEIIDTDVIAKELVTTNSAAFQQIIDHFDTKILTENAELNRSKLRQIIFADKKEKRWLENLLHPLIRQQMWKRVSEVTSPYCILVIPLLFESPIPEKIDRILVVEADKNVRIDRVMQRDHCSSQQVKNIITAQCDYQHYPEDISKMTDFIENNSDIETLKTAVKKLHNTYLQKCSA